MIAYLDTSALVALLLGEPGSAFVRHLWVVADALYASTLIYPEARSAIARAWRGDRVSEFVAAQAVRTLNARLRGLALVAPTRRVVWRAGDLAQTHGLRGYDAVHLSSAIEATGPGLALVTGDTRLAAAAGAVGLRAVVPE